MLRTLQSRFGFDKSLSKILTWDGWVGSPFATSVLCPPIEHPWPFEYESTLLTVEPPSGIDHSFLFLVKAFTRSFQPLLRSSLSNRTTSLLFQWQGLDPRPSSSPVRCESHRARLLQMPRHRLAFHYASLKLPSFNFFRCRRFTISSSSSRFFIDKCSSIAIVGIFHSFVLFQTMTGVNQIFWFCIADVVIVDDVFANVVAAVVAVVVVVAVGVTGVALDDVVTVTVIFAVVLLAVVVVVNFNDVPVTDVVVVAEVAVPDIVVIISWLTMLPLFLMVML